MNNYQNNQKVTANHLKRNAYLYIRQSTLRQVFENTESTKRQYALSCACQAFIGPLKNCYTYSDCSLKIEYAADAVEQKTSDVPNSC